MSEIVARMDMPTNCVSCPMGDDDSRFCKAAKKYIPMLGKPSWCPIKGVLIRCGECRRAIPFSVAGNRDAFCHCDLFDATMTRNDFCNYGERKDGDPE